ncbi:MAG: CHASE3 domain-containing protein, partial [Lysobacterales bacterium]
MRWRTAGLLLAILVIVALPYVVTLSNSRDTQQAANWVTHSNAVKALTYQVAYLARDSEGAIYRLLAGDSNELTQKRALLASQQVPALVRQLREMTRDNPDQQLQIGALESRLNGRIALLDQAQSRLQQGNTVGARQSLRDAGDLFVVNDEIAGIVHTEDSLLGKRQEDARRQTFNGRVVLAITALAQLLLLPTHLTRTFSMLGQRQMAETRESRAVQRSQQIFQAVREPIALFDGNLNSLLVNNAFRELYGMDPSRNAQPLAAIGDGAWND